MPVQSFIFLNLWAFIFVLHYTHYWHQDHHNQVSKVASKVSYCFIGTDRIDSEWEFNIKMIQVFSYFMYIIKIGIGNIDLEKFDFCWAALNVGH